MGAEGAPYLIHLLTDHTRPPSGELTPQHHAAESNCIKRDDGNWEVKRPGSDRASAVTPTQDAGIDKARQILKNDGGGELQVRGVNGQIRAQDTVAPGNDPRSSRG